jgi:hypothetical protein
MYSKGWGKHADTWTNPKNADLVSAFKDLGGLMLKKIKWTPKTTWTQSTKLLVYMTIWASPL